ncbi:MAG: cytochrome c biogenesis protein CcsA [Phycisphaerae bacterium]|nr:cytochrome c biogenesis protein CcsA [Phycisphaerae bacterium]
MTGSYGADSLTFAIFVASAGFVAALAAARSQSPRLLTVVRGAIALLAGLLTISVLSLLSGLLGDDFRLKYVYENSEKALPALYKFSAFWAHQEGSLLLWGWMVALLSLVAAVAWRKDQRSSQAIALAVLIAAIGFFCVLLSYAATPFAPLRETVSDGLGLNPLLQTWAMAVHPPPVFLGYALSTIPFALLVGALATGEFDTTWIQRVRRWMLWTWLFAGIGIILGAEWAYEELAFGGYWKWDPVENASLLPWLTATGALHLLMAQQHRQLFKKLSASLIAATFLLCIIATYITRSGVVSSVHAFGESLVSTFFLDAILIVLVLTCVLIIGGGRPALRFMLLAAIISLLLFIVGAPWVRQALVVVLAALVVTTFAMTAPAFGVRQPLGEPVSRDGVFLCIGVLLVIMTLTTLVGTIFPVVTGALAHLPLIGRWFDSVPKEQGTAFYNTIVLPMAMALAGLMAFGPFLSYGRRPVGRWVWWLAVPLIVADLALLIVLLLSSGLLNKALPHSVTWWVARLNVTTFWAIACGVTVATGVIVVFVDLPASVAARIRATGEGAVRATLRLLDANHRRYGGQLAHLGLLIVIVGIAGSSLYTKGVSAMLATDESAAIGNYTVTLDHWAEEFRTADGRTIDTSAHEHGDDEDEAVVAEQTPKYLTKLATFKIERDGRPLGAVQAERRAYYDAQQGVRHVHLIPHEGSWLAPLPEGMSSSRVAIVRDGMSRDLYLVVNGIVGQQQFTSRQQDGSVAAFVGLAGLGDNPQGQLSIELIINPLVSWFWVGGIVLALGGIYSLLPRLRRGSASEPAADAVEQAVSLEQSPVDRPAPRQAQAKAVPAAQAGGKKRNGR